MNKVVSFNRDGYDQSIDYIKGLAIIFVILTHSINEQMHDYSLFCLWGDMAVPLFLIIQVFHSYKKGYENSSLKIKKNYYRVLRPFLIIQFSLFVLMLIGGGDVLRIAEDFLKSGGQGAGSYYVWIYLQFAILLPMFAMFFSRCSNTFAFIGFIILSQAIEVICCLIQIDHWVYRLLMFRYLLLFYLGAIIVQKGIVMNKANFVISLISAFVVILFNYLDFNTYPVFFQSGWKVFHWPCYFYVTGLLLYLLRVSYDYTKKNVEYFNKLIVKIGAFSYEIFLLQMVFFFFITYLRKRFGIETSWTIDIIVSFTSPFICIKPIIMFKECRSHTINKGCSTKNR